MQQSTAVRVDEVIFSSHSNLDRLTLPLPVGHQRFHFLRHPRFHKLKLGPGFGHVPVHLR